jgi:O-antigen/teichoic acid export membrane protein
MTSVAGKLTGLLEDFFTKGHKRSIEAKKNIMASLLIKGCSIAISLVLVPLALSYVNSSQYGIWLTLSSMVAWMSFFDIGFTQGLRNKFAEAKAKGDLRLARIYISTTYYYIGIIFIIVWIILIAANQFINWTSLLNLPSEQEREVSALAMIIFSYFCFQFVFRIITTILTADQKPAKSSLLDMLGQLLSLVIIFILTKITKGSLIYLGLAFTVAPTLVLIAANVILFNTGYRDYIPSVKLAKKEYAKDIMTLGIKFFVLQIASIVQYQTASFLIAHYFDTTQVTSYNIAYKYFSVLQMVFMITISPLWSGTTDAYTSGDYEWIRKVVKKYLLLLIPFILAGSLMLIFSRQVYNLWLGKNVVHISFSVSLLCCLFFSTAMFASIYVAVINGLGALKIQFITSIITPVAYLLISLVLIRKFNFGVESILIASLLSNVYGFVIAPIQYHHIFIRKSGSRIWYS